MKNIPSNLNEDPQLWIELLADNELSRDQRVELIAHLDVHPKLWRDCAMKMMEHQSLGDCLPRIYKTLESHCSLGANDKEISVESASASENSAMRRRFAWLLYALAPCLALVIGAAISHAVERQRYSQELGLVVDEDINLVSSYQRVFQAERTVENQLNRSPVLDLIEGRSILVELENTSETAVYCTDMLLPDFLVEALLLSGSELSVQEFSPPGLQWGNGENERPFYRLEIVKPVVPILESKEL